ncbi:MAG: cytochrome c-type biogenesis protein CcmH [Candidatus Solibacter usitatus]|nr:cytochrome c-type biogenesis protein CcmH [Candidatus Solibacter usitatus]
MQNRLKLRSKLLLALLLTVALVEGTVPLTNERVRRLGDMLKCKCGCQASITGCNMINCHFSDPVRTQLLQMADQGLSDSEVFAEMERVYGKEILLKPPAEGFYLLSWTMPFVGLAGGLGIIYLVLRRYMKRRPAAEGPDPAETESSELAQYRERIDKDLSDME